MSLYRLQIASQVWDDVEAILDFQEAAGYSAAYQKRWAQSFRKKRESIRQRP